MDKGDYRQNDMTIVPTILEKTRDSFIYQLTRLSDYYGYFQIDIADGLFVQNKTLSIEEAFESINRCGSRIRNQCQFDLHLMVNDYLSALNKIDLLSKNLKLNFVFIHHLPSLPSDFYSLPSARYIPGLVINPKEQTEEIVKKYDLKKLLAIQIMTVDPGFQGSPFIEQSLNKIEQLRLNDYRNKIFIDGSVNDKTLPVIMSKEYKPDVMCVGSFLTHAENLKGRVDYLKNFI